ncbi:MAG TPA: PLDc N-terminal domain-containing protein, partial [Ferruginibacter sp.]|nr:PLDc N-terminal domain-containing protein [Ferruginibacter sp.]
MSWFIIAVIIYVFILVLVWLRIIYETRSTNKTLAYLLSSLFIPVIGVFFYLMFGINYWRKRRYGKKMAADIEILQEVSENSAPYKASTLIVK